MFWPMLNLDPINLVNTPYYFRDCCPCVKGNTQVSARIDGRVANHHILTIVGALAKHKVYVASYNIIEGITEYKQVTHAFPLPTKEIIRITDNTGRFVECSPDHKFWLENKKDYIPARELSFTDTLRHSDGNFGYDLEVVKTLVDTTVYQITVDGNRNFYANGILVAE